MADRYADGTYVRAADLDMHRMVTGRLLASELGTVLDRLEVEGGFFDYPVRDGYWRCMTDGADTHVLLHRNGRAHRITSYIMSWLGMHLEMCPPGSPGLPIGPETDRFYALARVVAALNAPLSDTEVPYEVQHATVYAEPSPFVDPTPVPWPLPMPMADAVGVDTLTSRQYATLLAAIVAHRPWEDSEFAIFSDGPAVAAVGVRVEVPDWLAYCAGEEERCQR